MLSRTAIILIRFYQLAISPYLGKNCIFSPTCSEYALQVYKDWGFIKGSWLTLKRISRCCVLWSDGGYDPPPKNFKR